MSKDDDDLRVWIELEQPKDEAHGKKICEHANRMLERLSPNPPDKFRYFEGTYRFGGRMGSVELIDRGTWLNLGYVGRPLDYEAGIDTAQVIE